MIDLRIVSAKTVLKIFSIAPIRGFLPLSVVVVGQGLNQADEVRYNGIQAEEFFIQSENRLIVRIPASQVGQPMHDVTVLAPVSATKKNALLTMSLGAPLKTVSGMDRLVQCWMMIFMSTPGTDIFDPDSGGGAKNLVGRATNASGTGVAADLQQAIERTKTELLRIQSRRTNIPLAEKLLSSSLDAIHFDPDNTLLSARVTLRNMAGSAAELNLR
jgi:hypothetical protein